MLTGQHRVRVASATSAVAEDTDGGGVPVVGHGGMEAVVAVTGNVYVKSYVTERTDRRTAQDRWTSAWPMFIVNIWVRGECSWLQTLV